MSIGCRSPHWRSPNVVYVRSSRMAFELLPLPFSRDALAPHMSGETLDFHHGKHHKAYVDKVNGWIEEKDLRGRSLVEVIRLALDKGDKGLFNNAGQVWHHNFFWSSLAPAGQTPHSSEQRREGKKGVSTGRTRW